MPADAPTPPADALRQRIADAIRDNLKRRTTPGLVHPCGHPIGGMGLTEYDIADVALAVMQPELDQLHAFCDRVDTLTAVAKSNGRAHRIAAEECHRLAAHLATAQAQLTAATGPLSAPAAQEIRRQALQDAREAAQAEACRLEALPPEEVPTGVTAARGARCVAHVLHRMTGDTARLVVDRQPPADR